MTTLDATALPAQARTPSGAAGRYWWCVAVGLSALVVGCTYLQVAGAPHADGRWSPLLSRLTLSSELTVGAWLSGMLLLIGAVMAISAASTTRRRGLPGTLGLTLLALGLAVLCLDELASLHERLDRAEFFLPRALRLPPVAAVGMVGLVITFVSVHRLCGRTGARWRRIAVGFGLLGSVYAQELLEHFVVWSDAWWPMRTAIEEGTELVGMLLILSGLMDIRTRLAATGPIESAGACDRRSVARLAWGVVAVAPLLIVLQYAMPLEGVWKKSAPPGLAPELILLALAGGYAWLLGRDAESGRRAWRFLAASLLLCSLEAGAQLRDLVVDLPLDRMRGDLTLLLLLPALVGVAWAQRSWRWVALAAVIVAGVAFNALVFKTPWVQLFSALVPVGVVVMLERVRVRAFRRRSLPVTPVPHPGGVAKVRRAA